MTNDQAPDGAEMEQIKIVLNSLYLCLGHALEHIAKNEGAQAASEFKAALLRALKNGDIDTALLEESRTFEFVVSKIEGLNPPDA